MTDHKPPAPILFLDIETTGVEPENDVILEIAWVVDGLDPAGVVEVFLPELTPAGMQTKTPLVVAMMHTASGLLADRQGLSLTPMSEIEDHLCDTISSMTTDRKPQLGGFSVHFDLSFLRVHMPRAAALLSHRVCNVSTLRDLYESVNTPRDPLFPDLFPVAGESTHRAAADALAAKAAWELIFARVAAGERLLRREAVPRAWQRDDNET